MGNLNIEPVPLNDPHIANASYHTRVVKSHKSIRMSGEMRAAKVTQNKSLRGLDGPHALSIDTGGYHPIDNLAERVEYRNGRGDGSISPHTINNPPDNISSNTTASSVVDEDTLTPLISSLGMQDLHKRFNPSMNGILPI